MSFIGPFKMTKSNKALSSKEKVPIRNIKECCVSRAKPSIDEKQTNLEMW